MKRKTFTEWAAEIDRLAIRDGICEPGASYTHRFGRNYWFETYYIGKRYIEPGVAWELESEKSLQDQDEEL